MKRLVIGVFIIYGLSVLPIAASAQTTSYEAQYRAVLLELIEQLTLQISLLQTQLLELQAAEEEVSIIVDVGSYTNTVDVIASYKTKSSFDIKNISSVSHKNYFERILELFPDEYDDRLQQFIVFAGSDIDAYVETIPPQHDSWLFAAHQEMIEEVGESYNSELIIHEFAHVLSYDELLGMPMADEINCHSHFTRSGCPLDNSYLGEFVAEFWSDKDLDRAEHFSQLDDSFEEAFVYYKNHSDEFVSDYAALSPEEDFSETFAVFVLENKLTKNSLESEKVEFFYQYSKLLEIRSEIRKSL